MSLALPQLADPLGEALHFLRISGMFYCRSEFTLPWALDLPEMDSYLMLHAVTSGRCWIEAGEGNQRLLTPGDLALVPHGKGHQLASGPGMTGEKLFDLPREQVSERYEVLRMGGGGEKATVICGVFRFDDPAARHLLTLLPSMIVVEAGRSPNQEWVESTLRMMAVEAIEPRPGGETVITRLADILVIQAIRAWIAQDPAAQTGWLGALQDKQIGRAISRIHREPERTWTLESLASEAAMSRSAFAARFTELVGEPAMRYVTRWKMHTAITWLRESNRTVGDIARRLGYESEAAFNRAFKRCVGVAPGAARRSPDQRVLAFNAARRRTASA